MTQDTTSAVSLSHVELRLDNNTFLFDCEIATGRITAVTGPSGSGKSTLLNLIAGFDRPDAGTVFFNGADAATQAPSERPVSLVFQDNNLFSHLDVFTNVGLGISPSLKLQQQERLAVSAALERVGLSGYERRKPGTLSGGERQRVAFARALVRHQPVLLLDEPFAALDPAMRTAMGNLLLDLQRETGATVLMVTHDIDEVRRLADDVLFIETGKVTFQGSRDAFLDHRTHSAIRLFVTSS